MEDEYQKYEILSRDDNFSSESDEYDYDSDCSLGSMNSLYLCLKNDVTNLNSIEMNRDSEKRLLRKHCRTNGTATNNVVTKTDILDTRNFKDNAKSKKISTISFYRKQETKISYTQQIHPRLYYRRQRKITNINSKKIKTKYVNNYKFKRNINKLRIALKKRQHKTNSPTQRILHDKYLFMKKKSEFNKQIKDFIPLLPFSRKIQINIEQESKEFSENETVIFTHIKDKYKQFFETNIDTSSLTNDYENKIGEDFSSDYFYIENQTSELKSFFSNDMDSVSEEIGSIVKKLFDDDNENNIQGSINKHYNFNDEENVLSFDRF